MKRYFFLIFFLILFSCRRDAGVNFNRIVIHYVHKEITAFVSIGCNGFDTFFGSQFKTIEITDSTFVQEVRLCLEKERYIYKKNIDVRAKIYLCKDKKIVAVYCMDRAGDLIVNNKQKVSNKCLVELVNKKMEENNLKIGY